MSKFRSLSRFSRPYLITAIVLLVLLLGLGWALNGRAATQEAHAAYLSGDCEAALALYGEVEGVFGRFIPDVKQERRECRALVAAKDVEEAGPEAAIAAYEQFVADYEDSPLTTPALAAIYRIYLDWATAEKEGGAYWQALAILEKATVDYPALEAETEERILQSYLA